MLATNRTYNELAIDDSAELTRRVTADDLVVFATASGNHNPLHLQHIKGAPATVPGMFMGALISALLGTRLPGPGATLRACNLRFPARAHADEEVRAKITLVEKCADQMLRMQVQVWREDGLLLAEGEVLVEAPPHKISFDDADLPALTINAHKHFDAMLALAAPLPALVTAVVCPEDANAMEGALKAMDATIITPIFVGHKGRIAQTAAALGRDISGIEVIHAETGLAAATRAVALVHEGRVGAVMKGHLHTDDLLRPMLDSKTGLKIGRRFTHIFVMDVPGLSHPLLVSDAAINIAPDLATKVDICQNAIDLAISLGISEPKVGVLSAVETVNPQIPSSLDAALLSKMAERGQIRGGIVDGPLAMDNAVDLAAAKVKGIKSAVAGRADVLVVPNLDAGNMLAKQLTYLSHAEAAGVVMGAMVPIILNSRADSDLARLASCAVAALHHARMSAQIPSE